MAKWAGKLCSAVCAALLMLPISGCFPSRAEEMYSLPQISDTYGKLQQAVDSVLREGAEYSSPAAGTHRQAVQLEDLDGDGVQEAVAFFRIPEAEAPMTVCVFTNLDGAYTETLRISGEGTGFDKVAYADLDGDGVQEILVGRQMGAELKLFTAYSPRDNQPAVLFTTDYTDYLVGDFTGDSLSDVAVARVSAGSGGEAEVYTVTGDGEVLSSRAVFSAGAESLTRLRTTSLMQGQRGFLAESVYGAGGIVTDVFGWRNDSLVNLTLSEKTGVSDDTARSYAVYATDLNDDGLVEIPSPVAMPSQGEGTVYYRLDWWIYGLHGQRRQVMTTYHNYNDGWYLELDPSWAEVVTVRRVDTVSGERTVIFSVADEAGNLLYDYLAIYTLSGDNREERAALGERFVLRSEGSTVYAAQLLSSSPGFGMQLSQETVQESFHMIYSDWETGEN